MMRNELLMLYAAKTKIADDAFSTSAVLVWVCSAERQANKSCGPQGQICSNAVQRRWGRVLLRRKLHGISVPFDPCQDHQR